MRNKNRFHKLPNSKLERETPKTPSMSLLYLVVFLTFLATSSAHLLTEEELEKGIAQVRVDYPQEVVVDLCTTVYSSNPLEHAVCDIYRSIMELCALDPHKEGCDKEPHLFLEVRCNVAGINRKLCEPEDSLFGV